MGFIEGDERTQGILFAGSLEELIPSDHFCRVIDALVDWIDMQRLGFVRAEAAETGRPGYDPRDLLKLYLYGYLQQIRSSRRLESECRRNVELMWLLGRLCPDHKSIAEFRRLHRHAVTQAGTGEDRAFGGVDPRRMDCHRRFEVPGGQQCQQRPRAGRSGALSGESGKRRSRRRTGGGK